MREIKFRAWHRNLLEMEKDVHLLDRFSEIIASPEKYAIMQYTGLKDKNGKEIYEGDVVATRVDTRGEVVFYNAAWRVKRGNYKPTPIPAYTWKEVFEVIGNIYENPELLKK